MKCPLPDFSLLGPALRNAWHDTLRVSYDLFKILIPLVILIKLFTVYGLIHYVALPLEPIMRLTGLPPELGLAWATGIITNVYSSLIIFVSIAPNLDPLTVAQTTTFGIMVLMAHSLPMEGRIVQQCGLSGLTNTVIRLVVAVATAMLFKHVAAFTGGFSEHAVMAFQAPQSVDPTLTGWALTELRNLVSIFCVIFVVMLIQRALKYFKISVFLGYILSPLLRLLGMGPSAATTVVVGFCMGLLYGSGIIIKDAQSGELTPAEVFSAVTLMALAHALIEDTFIMVLIGASLWGVLITRLFMAVLVGVLLNLLYLRPRHTNKACS